MLFPGSLYSANPAAKIVMESKPRVIFVLGGPGVGKGTQCKMLVDTQGFIHLSAGDLLRAERLKGSAQGELIEKIAVEGRIVPSEITVGLLRNAMQSNGWASKRFLVDGFPRNQENVDVWNRIMTDAEVEFLLFIDCPEVRYRQDMMISRILGRNEARSDDNIETLRKRLVTYREQTTPVIDLYEREGKVRKISGEGTPEAVHSLVLAALNPH